MKTFINKSLKNKPRKELLEKCGQYYSPYYNLMYLLGKEMKDKGVAVELGSETGRGSTAFALSGIESYGVDNKDRREVRDVESKFENFTFIFGSSLPVPPQIQGKQIAVLHIDTEHSYSQAENEFKAYEPYLIDGAYVLFDDTHAAEDDVLDFVLSLPYEKIEEDDLHPTCGYAVVRYEK